MAILKKIGGAFIVLLSLGASGLFVFVLMTVPFQYGQEFTIDREFLVLTLFAMFILVFGILGARYGVRLMIKPSKTEEEETLGEYVDQDFVIEVEAQLNLKDYLHLSLAMLRRRLSKYGIAVFVLVGFMMFVLISNMLNKNESILPLLGVLVFCAALPLLFFLFVQRDFQSKQTLSERTIYTFRLDGFSIVGESFQDNVAWEKIHKVDELEKWFILYLSETHAYNVPKSGFANQTDVDLFRRHTQ